MSRWASAFAGANGSRPDPEDRLPVQKTVLKNSFNFSSQGLAELRMRRYNSSCVALEPGKQMFAEAWEAQYLETKRRGGSLGVVLRAESRRAWLREILKQVFAIRNGAWYYEACCSEGVSDTANPGAAKRRTLKIE